MNAVKCKTQEVEEMNASIEEGKCGGKGEGMAGRGKERKEWRKGERVDWRESDEVGTEVGV